MIRATAAGGAGVKTIPVKKRLSTRIKSNICLVSAAHQKLSRGDRFE